MRKYRIFTAGSLLAMTLTSQVLASGLGPEAYRLAQVSAPVDRSLGNGSMGVGQGIRRLPDPSEEKSPNGQRQDLSESHDRRDLYQEPSHGDSDTDMEHRKHRTLGDGND